MAQQNIARWKHYLYLIRLDKPIGILLLLWPSFWALWIAGDGHPDTKLVIVFGLGVFSMRAAGCIINDIFDQNIDRHVERTQQRPLATGAIRNAEAWALFIGFSLLALGLVLFTNKLTVLMSGVGILLAASYPLLKRFTYLPQIYLGVAFGWAIPMAFAAQTRNVPMIAWMLFIANVFWTTAYDTIYAMVDRDDDLKIGVKSTAILFGDADRLIITLLYMSFFASMFLVGSRLEMGHYYYYGLIVAILFSIYEIFLIRRQIREWCFKAFLNNNWIGMSVFGGILANYYLN